MSSFASSFFAPPNKIDWDRVNPTELLNNPTVTIIVCGIFLLYLLLLVWARRADKRDFQLVRVFFYYFVFILCLSDVFDSDLGVIRGEDLYDYCVRTKTALCTI